MEDNTNTPTPTPPNNSLPPNPPSTTPSPAPLNPQTPHNNDSDPGPLQRTANAFSSFFAFAFSWFVFPIFIVLILHNFVFQAYHVVGTSMATTLEPSDYLIISKVGYTKALIERAFHQNAQYIPSRGEIIVFHYPRDPTEVFVKRVIALPGDHIVIKNGKVTVYNKNHPQGFNPDVKYESSNTATLIDTDEVVAPNSVFVMGDNRTPGGSYDSREWGELQSSYIIGNAVLRLLPLDQAKIL